MRAVICTSLFLLAACSSIIGIEDVALDPGQGDQDTCLVAKHLDELVLTDETLAFASRSPSGSISLAGALGVAELPDIFSLQLFAGEGVFTSNGVEPGNYLIAGDEREYETCGLCALILADVVTENNEIHEATKYLADAGRVELHEVADRFQADLFDVTLREVRIAPAPDFTTTDSFSGCRTRIDAIHIDVTYAQE